MGKVERYNPPPFFLLFVFKKKNTNKKNISAAKIQ